MVVYWRSKWGQRWAYQSRRPPVAAFPLSNGLMKRLIEAVNQLGRQATEIESNLTEMKFSAAAAQQVIDDLGRIDFFRIQRPVVTGNRSHHGDRLPRSLSPEQPPYQAETEQQGDS